MYFMESLSSTTILLRTFQGYNNCIYCYRIMKEAFLQHIQAKKKRRQREASKYVLAVMQDVREGRKMACRVTNTCDKCGTQNL